MVTALRVKVVVYATETYNFCKVGATFWTCQPALVSIPLVVAFVAEHHITAARGGSAWGSGGRRWLRLGI
jgi:hypothetical protein